MIVPLVERLRRALTGVARVEAPPSPLPSGAAVGPDLLATFTRQLEQAAGRVVRLPDVGAFETWLTAEAAGRPVVRAEDEPTEDVLRAAGIGVDRADLLVAETGTVVRTWPSRQGARTSLVPPVSVFVAPEEALVRDLPTALRHVERLHEGGRRYTGFLTGPSRTADIEKRLVIPAHGPRELVVVVLGR